MPNQIDLTAEYLPALNDLQNYLDFAVDISDCTGGRKNVPMELSRGHQLYIRLTVSCMSFLRLLPHNRYFPTDFNFWDFPSAASLSRNIIEIYYAFFYIARCNDTPEIIEFKLLVLDYHNNWEKYRIYKESGIDAVTLKEFENNLPLDKEKINSHPVFSTLSPSMKKRVLKGYEFMYLTHEDLSKMIGFDTDFSPKYRFLSNQTHSTPFSFFSQSNERGRGIINEAEVFYMTLCIKVVTRYLLASILDMTNLFSDCKPSLNQTKLAIIKAKFESLDH